MAQHSIEVRDIHKTFRLYGKPWNRIAERFPWNKAPRHRAVHALRGISFDVEPGQCMGLIGTNGAGKSTLLKILSGTTYPTQGSYTVRGSVASLLELGAGFHQDFTGRENILMNAAMMGHSRKDALRRMGEIIEFSGLGEFISAPIRTYSSGMICRLGFSVAVATNPDILIIDEILAVGDMNFQRRCIDKIWEFKRAGKTMFFCSHSLYNVRQICENALWLRKGELMMHADAVTVTNEYSTFEDQSRDTPDETPFQRATERFGKDDHPRILDAVLVDPTTGKERHEFDSGESVGVRVHLENGAVPEPLTVVVGFQRKDGTLCFAPHSGMDGVRIDFSTTGWVTLVLPDVRLLSGEFTVPVWLADERAIHRIHERPAQQTLVIRNRDKELGLFRPERRWYVEPGEGSAPGASAGGSRGGEEQGGL